MASQMKTVFIAKYGIILDPVSIANAYLNVKIVIISVFPKNATHVGIHMSSQIVMNAYCAMIA